MLTRRALGSSGKKRRDSTRIIHDILLASRNGVSKTRAVYESNLNFRLFDDYLDFLLKMGYLERSPNGSSHDVLRLTEKGMHLLELLDQLETEIKPFRMVGVRRETGGSKHHDETYPSFDHSEAIQALKRARDLTSREKTSRKNHEYQISLALLQAYALQGQVADEAAEIDRVLTLAESLADKSKLAEAHAWKSNHLTRVGNYQEAVLEGRRSLEFAKMANDESRIAGAQLAIGEALIFLGGKDEPLDYFSTALKYYQERGDRLGQANVARLTAQVYLGSNNFSGALDQAGRALALFRDVGDRVGEDETLRYLGDISCAQGDYLSGLDYYKQVLKIRRDIGNRSREGGALGDIGDVYLSLGEYEKSLELHRQSLAIDREVGYRFGLVWDHHDLGMIQFNLGNMAEARHELVEALRIAENIDAPDLITLCKNDLSTVLRTLGGNENLKDALQIALEASTMSEDYALPSGRIRGETGLAMAYRALGSSRDALDHSERAVKLLGSNSQTDDLEEEVLFNHYLVLRDQKPHAEAENYLKKAHDKMVSKAAKIKDSSLRDSFLSRVIINRNIRSAWKIEGHSHDQSSKRVG